MERARAWPGDHLFPATFTYELWVRFDGLRDEKTPGNAAYLLHGQTPGTEDKIFLQIGDSGATLQCRFIDGGPPETHNVVAQCRAVC